MVNKVSALPQLGLKLAALALIVLFQWQLWVKNDWIAQVQSLRSQIEASKAEDLSIQNEIQYLKRQMLSLKTQKQHQEGVVRERLGYVAADEMYYAQLETDR